VCRRLGDRTSHAGLGGCSGPLSGAGGRWCGSRRRSGYSVTALNVTNRHLLIDNSLTFGGTHYNHPREVYAELRYRFHY
jgi:hypothetical protein